MCLMSLQPVLIALKEWVWSTRESPSAILVLRNSQTSSPKHLSTLVRKEIILMCNAKILWVMGIKFAGDGHFL